MSLEFQKGVVKPMECFREGWELIKDQYWLFFAITLVGFIIGSVIPFMLFLGPMMTGIYYPIIEKAERRPVEFGQLFKGVSKFMPTLIATLPWALPLQILMIVAYIPMVIVAPMMESRAIKPETALTIIFASMGSLFLVLIIWMFFHPFLMFVYQIIAEHEISGWDALKLSIRSVWGNLGGVVGLLALNVLAYSIGALLCGIGAYFVLPLIFANTFVAYRKVFPKRELGTFDNPPPPSAFNI